MGRTFDRLDETLTTWISQQPMFFVATAPSDLDGHINLSPKGDARTFRVLGPTQFAYLDLLGSGVETIAHIRENGRIVIMFCAFNGPPKVLRLYGRGRVIQANAPEFERIVALFEPSDEALGILRSVILVDIDRIGDSCGFVVPKMGLVEQRDQLVRWGEHQAEVHGDGWKSKYLQANNLESIDGLDGLNLDSIPDPVEDADAAKLSSVGKAL